MEMNHEMFLKEKTQIEKLPESEQKAYYIRWLEVHPEKTISRVDATLSYARILYREGAFRQVMEVLMPVVMNHHAYPYCEELITCFNQMGLAVNCESEYTLARHFFQLALELAETHHVTSVYAKQHNNIGLTYYDQFKLDEAAREYRLAEKWLPESSLKEIIGPMVYGNWSNVLLRQQHWAEALEAYKKGLSYQVDDTEDVDNQILGMIIYYKLGMRKEYQESKRRFCIVIKKQSSDMAAFYYSQLLLYKIDPEDKKFMADAYQALETFLKNPCNNINWRGRTVYADLLYEKALKEKNTDAMLTALRLKSDIQVETIELTEKKRSDALNEYIDISAEKQKALEQAEEATRAKSQFLSNMSHDIRTPMNAIYGLTQLMEHDKSDPEKMDDYIQKLKSSSKHLLSLINDVLDMSKIESSEVILNQEIINLCDQITQLKSIISPQTEEKKQNLCIRIHEIRHEYLFGDAVRLRQILINLLSNAVKYTPNGGNIDFDITEKYNEERKSSIFEFSVTDTGCGMSKDFMEHIFEPFTRAENSMTNKIQGTGLGMAITKNIVDIMGGMISVTSELGKGSCFTVDIPLDVDTETEIKIPFEHILMLTQDKSIIQNAVTAFHGAEFNLEVAKSIADAEAYLNEHQTDVILIAGHYTLVQLADIVARLKKEAGTTEIVFCLDYDQKEISHEILMNCGIHRVIERPIFLTELTDLFNQFVEEEGEQNQTTDTILQGMNFLCAEDNTLNADILEAILEMEGASCTILPDGKQIVEKFKNVTPGEYDAILMDLQMPVMNGLEAAKAIRRSENPLGRTIPIIAMTANAFSSDVQDCLDAGMDAHLAKPLDVEALKRTVQSLVGRKYSGGGAKVRSKKTDIVSGLVIS